MKKFILPLTFVVIYTAMNAQNVGIGTNTPAASAKLDITSNNSGLLIPRINLLAISNPSPISLPVEGLLVYNTNSNISSGNGTGFYYWDGIIWKKLSDMTANTLDQAYDMGGAGAGREIDAVDGSVAINGEDGFIVRGTYGTGLEVGATNGIPGGTGTRMFFNPRKAAFRAGYVNGTQWDDINIGNYSVAIGNNASATGVKSTAMGSGTVASGEISTAMGLGTIASGGVSLATGLRTTASADESTAMGLNTQATGGQSTAMGHGTVASGPKSTAMGYETTASGNISTVMGFGTTAASYGETAIGLHNTDATSPSSSSYVPTDRLFVIGNGTSNNAKSNAFVLLKNGNATLAGTLTQNSDRRLKTNILPLSNSLSTILQLGGYSYNWLNTKKRGHDKQIGLIAQEVQALYPELVSKDDQGILSVNYTGLVPVLIEATKEQQGIIEQQNAKIEQQNAKMIALENEMKEIRKLLNINKLNPSSFSAANR